jgi:hypothetical protein
MPDQVLLLLLQVLRCCHDEERVCNPAGEAQRRMNSGSDARQPTAPQLQQQWQQLLAGDAGSGAVYWGCSQAVTYQ